MFSPFCSLGAIRIMLVAATVILLVGCSSEEDRARSYYERGMKFVAEQDTTKAAIEFRNAVKLETNLIEGWKALAAADEANGDWRHVIADMRTIVELVPSDVSAKLKLGKLVLHAGSPYEALSLANAGLDLDDRNAGLHALKAAAALKLDNQTEAIHEAETALEFDPTNADALMLLAIDRLGKGDVKGSLSLLQDPAVAQEKNLENNVSFQLLKIKLLGQTGDSKGAEAALNKLVELNPLEPGYRKLLVNFYVEHRRTDDAEKELRGLAADSSANSEAALDLVRFLYTIKKDPVAARQELNARIRAGGDVFPYQMALADMDLADGKLAEGRQLLEGLVSTDSSPEHVRTAKIALAQIYMSNRNFEHAEKLATDVLADDPHHVSALKLRASVRLEGARPDAAVTDLVDALNYQPRSTDLMLLLARAYERSGLIELADKQFADATRISDLDVNIGLGYAGFLQRRGSIVRSEDILIGLDKRRPNNIRVLSALAQVRLARQDWKGAQEIAEAIRRIDSSGQADQILGATLIGRHKYDEAITAFQAAYNAAPTAAQPINFLIATLLKANRKDQALAFLKTALTKDPNNANALVLLGTIQLNSGAADLAIKNFLAAVKAQPKDVVGYRALADLYVNQKNYGEAIKVIRSGIEQQPEFDRFAHDPSRCIGAQSGLRSRNFGI